MKAFLRFLRTDRSFVATLVIFFAGLVLTFYLFYTPQTVLVIGATSGVLGRSYPVSSPDIYANQGGTVTVEGVTAIVSEGTFAKDAYLRVDRTARVNPKSVQGLWQVTDMWQVRLRSHDTDDEFAPSETKKSYILSFPYTTTHLKTDQGVQFAETSLTLARADTADGPWEVLGNAVLDYTNDTVSVLTNRGGFYMIVGGYGSQKYRSSVSISTPRPSVTAVAEKETEKEMVYVVVTATPTSVKQLDLTSTDEAEERGFLRTVWIFVSELFGG